MDIVIKICRLLSWPLAKPLEFLWKFIQDLISQQTPQSIHNLTNLLWGVGSFILYWRDHFKFGRALDKDDFIFIAAMSGFMSLLAAVNKKWDNQSTVKKDDQPSGES